MLCQAFRNELHAASVTQYDGGDRTRRCDQCAARRAKARIVAKTSSAASPIRIAPATP